MHIEFLKLRFKNFLSVGNEFAEFDLNADPFTVIVGENGTGKSTITDAIIYALYGKPLRKVTLGLLINSINNKNCLVELLFKVGSDTYLVRRGQKPKVFEIYKNKVLIPEESVLSDYQEHLEKDILQVNMKSFLQINVIGKANWVPFMGLTAADRRKVVEDLLDGTIYTVMQSIAKERFKTVNTDIQDMGRSVDVINSKIRNTQAILSAYNEDISSRIDEIKKTAREDYITLQAEQEKVAELQTQIDAAKGRSSEALGADPDKFVVVFDTLQRTITEAETNINRLTRDNNNIGNITVCQACRQPMDENHKHSVINTNTAEIAELNTTLIKNKERFEILKDRKSKAMEAANAFNNLTGTLKNVEYTINSLKTAIDKAKEQVAKLSEPKKLEGVEDIESLNKDLADAESNINALHKTKELLKNAIDFLKDDGIKAKLVDQYIGEINKTMNEYLEKLDLFVQFELDSEFNETIKSHYRDKFSYHSFSEGQKMRIDLALMLTWRKIARLRSSASTNILILDEVMDGSMNDAGVRDFLAIIEDIDVAPNKFVISHNNATIDLFENVITARLAGNFTEYEKL